MAWCSALRRARERLHGRRKHKKVGEGGGEGTVSRGTFGMKRALKRFFPEMLATGKGGREGKINAIINQRLLRPTHG